MPAKRHNIPARRSRRAFTLIELLTVVAIIAILAALTFTGLAKARYAARNSRCLSNFRQDGIGFLLYANDHHNKPPGPFSTDQQSCEAVASTGQLAVAMEPYLDVHVPANGNPAVILPFVCPAWEAASGRYAAGYDQPNNSYSSMILRVNTKLCGGGGGNFTQVPNLNQLPDINGKPGTPSTTYLMCDNTSPTSSYAAKLPNQGKWHYQYTNAVYLDGHVATVITP